MDINTKWTKQEVYTCEVEPGYTITIRKLTDEEKSFMINRLKTSETIRDAEVWAYEATCQAHKSIDGEPKTFHAGTDTHGTRVTGETRESAMKNAFELYLHLPLSKQRHREMKELVRASLIKCIENTSDDVIDSIAKSELERSKK